MIKKRKLRYINHDIIKNTYFKFDFKNWLRNGNKLVKRSAGPQKDFIVKYETFNIKSFRIRKNLTEHFTKNLERANKYV